MASPHFARHSRAIGNPAPPKTRQSSYLRAGAVGQQLSGGELASQSPEYRSATFRIWEPSAIREGLCSQSRMEAFVAGKPARASENPGAGSGNQSQRRTSAL